MITPIRGRKLDEYEDDSLFNNFLLKDDNPDKGTETS